MAGHDSRFDPTRFRDAIKFAMQMGFPEDTAKQVTWQWEKKRSFHKTDSGGYPLTWAPNQVATESDISDRIIDCAIQFVPVGGAARVGGTELGIMDVAGVTATLLDTDYDILVSHGQGTFPDKASMDGDIYVVQYIEPPIGIFEVTVYSVHLQAIDET